VQGLKKNSNSTLRSGVEGKFSRQLEKIGYGRKSSSNKRGQINETLHKNSMVPAFEPHNGTYGKEISGKIQISRDKNFLSVSNTHISIEDSLAHEAYPVPNYRSQINS
jgi:hypothetical protein